MDRKKFILDSMALLRAQGEYSVSRNGESVYGCYYRHPQKNLKCILGFHIPDGEYHPSYEGNALRYVFRPGTNARDILTEKYGNPSEEDFGFLAACQRRLHDDAWLGWRIPSDEEALEKMADYLKNEEV